MTDLTMIATGVLTVAVVGTTGAATYFHEYSKRWKVLADDYMMRCRRAEFELSRYRAAEEHRRAHLKRIASLGAKASNAKRKGVRKVAIAKTIAAIPALTLRPRDEVVAGVREAREAKKSPAQSVAAK